MNTCSHCSHASSDHFKGKEAIQHIAEVQAEGIVTSSEIHGAETPGSIFSLFDAARETAVALAVIYLILSYLSLSSEQILSLLIAFGLAWAFWKMARASWLAWSRLERLHRVMEQERYEIEVNRSQERVELKALYEAKGFQGALLDEVVDVLMADGDRLLRVMLEEELGFRLEENEHPLVQGLGAFIGSSIALAATVLGYLFFGSTGLLAASLVVLGVSGWISARMEKNNPFAAAIWNLGMAIFCFSVAYFCMPYILP